MKLTTTTQLSLDGVMQSPGGPDEDDRGFTRGGWAHFDNESGEFVDQVFQRADAFLFGRKTYDVFAYTWGVAHKTEIRGVKHLARSRMGQHKSLISRFRSCNCQSASTGGG